ncbi:hypothetical protein [Nocardia transvalensis]|uniref:hypothetical protein n=1 Tax=Nocardia transvalensis TaxID=37333 RepID=UPI001893806A|nr:hypothetical protein [Nocardia transvalensis]MBF6332427.1 hypothetical protein [Nocardia transvalensis]
MADIVRTLATPLYGAATARQAAAEMLIDPVVTTANHAGLDTMADSFHGTLLHCLRGQQHRSDRRTAVVLSCGSVSLNNPTFPMGLLYYEPSRPGSVTRRLALLPTRRPNRIVRTAPLLTREHITRARARLTAAGTWDGEVSARSRHHLLRTLDEDVDIPDVLGAASFDDQSRLINARLWDRSVPSTHARPVYVELERVAAVLLTRDLEDTSSLIYPLMFDSETRDLFLRALDGVRTCWRTALLEQGDARGGTHLFWALSPHGTRRPVVVRTQEGSGWLVELSDTAEPRSWELAPEPLTAAIATGELIPAVPVCFIVVSFARGLGCIGAYYQAGFLPRMYAAVRTTLHQCGINPNLADVPLNLNLGGVQGILSRDADGNYIPLGPVALASEGGLSKTELDCMLRTPMVEAQIAALPEILPDLLPVGGITASDADLLLNALSATQHLSFRALHRT